MVQLFPDLMTWAKETGLSVALSILLGYALLKYLIAPHYTKLVNNIEKANKQIKELYQAEFNPDSPVEDRKLIGRHEIIQKIDRVYNELHSKHGIENCPVIPLLEKILEKKADEIKTLFEENKDTTREIFEDSKKFHNTLGMELIHALRDRRDGTTRSGSPEDSG